MIMRWLLALLIVALPTMAWAEIGQIKLLVGQVSLERDGRMTLAEKGQLIEASDIIVTGSDGRVGITFTDNTRFSAGPGREPGIVSEGNAD
ncbi:MAG: hypothetical protein HOH61_25220, partial [Rhodospirillaceae bacterium]|nr:hypothetical protein [Rhodospirillaceae bacterium]